MEIVISVDPHKVTNVVDKRRRSNRRAGRIGRAGDLRGQPERTAYSGTLGKALPGTPLGCGGRRWHRAPLGPEAPGRRRASGGRPAQALLAGESTLDRRRHRGQCGSVSEQGALRLLRGGVAPIEASSGEVVRHRLSLAGNRRLNQVSCT